MIRKKNKTPENIYYESRRTIEVRVKSLKQHGLSKQSILAHREVSAVSVSRRANPALLIIFYLAFFFFLFLLIQDLLIPIVYHSYELRNNNSKIMIKYYNNNIY